MSSNLKQIFDQNPASGMQEGDLFYLARSPYTTGAQDFAIEWSVFLTFLLSITDAIYPEIPVQINEGGTGGVTTEEALENLGIVIQNEVTVTATSITMVPNTIYYAENNSVRIQFIVPETFPKNSRFSVIGRGAGGWYVSFGESQQGQNGDETTATGGSWSSTNQYDVLNMIGLVENEVLQVISQNGLIGTDTI